MSNYIPMLLQNADFIGNLKKLKVATEQHHFSVALKLHFEVS